MDLNTSLTLLFSGVVAISTVVYAVLTRNLVKETKTSRLINITPNVHVYFSKAETSMHSVYFLIENFGYGVAVDLKLKIIKDFNNHNIERLKLANMGAFKHGLRYFYPKQKFKYYFTNLLEDFEKKLADCLIINVSYKDINNKEYSNDFVLTIDEIIGTGQSSTPPDSYIGKIWYELSEIKKVLKKE